MIKLINATQEKGDKNGGVGFSLIEILQIIRFLGSYQAMGSVFLAQNSDHGLLFYQNIISLDYL